MVVYGDLLFLVNFSMDFLCFYISCLLMHQKLPVFRACLSAFVGGIYSVVSLFITLKKTDALIIDLLVLVLMCLTVYVGRGVTLTRIIKGIFLYFFVSALLGGLMTALFSLFNRIELVAKDYGMGEGIDVWIFSLLAIVGSVITLGGGKIFRTSNSKKRVELILESEIGSASLCAIVDSGNLATEPISGKAVVFVSVEKCKKIIEKPLYDAIINNSYLDESSLLTLSKLRMIPTRSVSGRSFLPAVKFKKTRVKIGNKIKNIDVYIAFVNDNFSGDHDAIISDETII